VSRVSLSKKMSENVFQSKDNWIRLETPVVLCSRTHFVEISDVIIQMDFRVFDIYLVFGK
jgi:hypothetical protein